MEVLGIDIGGSGMKAAIVDINTGKMITERHRIPTPPSRNPDEMTEVIKQLVEHFDYKGKIIGCGFPSIVKKGICKDHGNLSPNWTGCHIEEMFEKATGCDITVINDADAAGFAEVKYGAGKNEEGFVVMITVGTGLGSGAYLHGELIPNFELGQIPYKDYKKIERWAASSIKEKEGLSFKQWGKRFNKFLNIVHTIIAPDLLVIGGGISKYWDKFEKRIHVDTPVVPAMLQNHSGIIGAAAAAWQLKGRSETGGLSISYQKSGNKN